MSTRLYSKRKESKKRHSIRYNSLNQSQTKGDTERLKVREYIELEKKKDTHPWSTDGS